MNGFHTILATTLLTVSLCACRADKTSEPIQAEPKAVEVPVSRGAATVEPTRALGPIDQLSYDEIYVAYAESAPGAYLTEPYYTRALRALITYGITVFQPLLFYPNVSGVCNNVYLKGFYPREGVTDFEGHNAELLTITDNKIHYLIDGRHDILLSSLVKGHYYDTIYDQYETNGRVGPVSENARLRFEHLLSNLSFAVRRGNSWPTTLKLTHIWVTGVSERVTLDLGKSNTDPDVLLFEPAHDKEFLVYENEQGLELNTSASAVIGQAMIEPGAEFQVKIRFNSGEIVTLDRIMFGTSTINILGDDASSNDIIRRGYRYTMTLDFNNLIINTTVSMAAWTPVVVGDDYGWW